MDLLSKGNDFMKLKEYIIKKSKEIGIDIIGFTDEKPFERLKKYLAERFKKGCMTEFEEEDLELRCTPQKVFADAKTIIVVGISYNVEYKGYKKMDNSIKKGRLSRSSWGIDYHSVLRQKMELLVDEIKKVKDFKYEVFVDTGPLIDREIAKKAGIGWYGKNCSIVNDEFGSFIFIGSIITDLEIEPDNPIEEKCGECNLCIKACPASAIQEGYIINPQKCISYLTQTKKKIPYDLREKMGVKIYGCDTCQLVCPNNKEVAKGKTVEFIPKKTRGYINLKELIKITNREFKEQYGHMAGSWRGRNILRRNAIIALGNIKDKGSINLLKSTLKDSSPMIREYSAWALLKIDRKLGARLVNEHINHEKDDKVKEEMRELVKYFEDE